MNSSAASVIARDFCLSLWRYSFHWKATSPSLTPRIRSLERATRCVQRPRYSRTWPGPSEGWFGIHDPFAFAVLPRNQAGRKGDGLPEGFGFTEETELSPIESVLRRLKEQAAKQTRKNAHGKKEAGLTADPAIVIRTETPAGDHAMDMGMMQQVLSPLTTSEEAWSALSRISRSCRLRTGSTG